MSFEESVMAAAGAVADSLPSVKMEATEADVKAAACRLARVGYDLRRTPRALDALRHYLAGKALCLCGKAGAGKTAFFHALRRAGVASVPIRVYSLAEHGGDLTSGVVEEVRRHAGEELVVDDVGSESTWGGRREDDLLLRVMAVREQSARRTHFTTNLTGAELRQRYDERVMSRLRFCVFVPFVNTDNREAVANGSEARRRALLADTASWLLCKERCGVYAGGCRCPLGRAVPPLVAGTSPEDLCGVGSRIPYAPGYLKLMAEDAAERARRLESFCRGSSPSAGREVAS